MFTDISEKLCQFGSLKEGWDSYHGAPISDNAILNAHMFLCEVVKTNFFERPVVSPEPNGGVLLKWRDNGREFLVWFTSHTKHFVYVKVSRGIRTGGKTESLDKLFEIFKKWIVEIQLRKT